MLFSEHTWLDGDTIRAYIKVNTAVSYAMMATPLRNAYNLFIVPLLGEEMAARLEAVCEEPEPKEEDVRLLDIARRANANLALWYEFDAISVRITDAGFQRQESENGTLKPAYKYQEDNLRQGYKEKGFNALDQLLDYLYTHLDLYPEFEKSDACLRLRSAIVRTTDDVNSVVFINGSRIIFLRLQPHLRFVEEMLLVPAIGEKLYAHLVGSLKNPPADEEALRQVEQLRRACANYVVAMAVRRLMMETGSLTDRGLYFSTIEAGEKGNEKRQPLGTDRIAMQIQNLKADADMYMTALRQVVRTHFAEFDAGSPQQVFDRDNDRKRTFWA